MAVFATDLVYWLNWRVFFCAIPLLGSILAAFIVLWKYDVSRTSECNGGETEEVNRVLKNDDAWKPCLKQINPLWLMVFRIVSFSLLVTTLFVKLPEHGFQIYFFYTQWTFTLLTMYFGLGSVLSIYACYRHQKLEASGDADYSITDEEQGSYSYIPIACEETIGKNGRKKLLDQQEQRYVSTAGIWCRIFEVMFQISAGAVVLTDCVYWFIIFPFMTIRDYPLNFMTVNVHTLNVVLLLGDTALNCLRLPWYRISYFIIWSGIFVIFQWIVHAFIPIWWPYPFMDLASPSAPMWYLVMGLAHIPCYGVFVLIIELKHVLFSKLFPHSYQCCKYRNVHDGVILHG